MIPSFNNPHQHKLFWRHHLGNIFGSIHCSKLCFPSICATKPILVHKKISTEVHSTFSSSSSSKIIAVIDLDQPSVFTSADSGDIPGVFSTALLKTSTKNYHHSNQQSPLDFANRFTMKPVDWISSVAMTSPSMQSRFYEFLELLDEEGNCTTTKVVGSSQKEILSSSRRDWTSTQNLQWRIRSLSLASNLAFFNGSLETAIPSWFWMKEMLKK